jgi:hypothetical protein
LAAAAFGKTPNTPIPSSVARLLKSLRLKPPVKPIDPNATVNRSAAAFPPLRSRGDAPAIGKICRPARISY